MKNTKNLYGENVAQKMVKIVDKIVQRPLFKLFEHERLGLDKLDFWQKEKINW